MNSRNTWRWIAVAVVLFAFILLHQRLQRKHSSGPALVLPRLKAGAATSIQVRPTDQASIRADRTNGTWELLEPVAYPAQSVSIEKLLGELERLKSAGYISPRELRDRPHTDEEYGFASPRASITVEQPGYTARLRVGATTTPGDQVFVQEVGGEGIYVVSADILQYLPRNADDWRDTTFIKLSGLAFDRLTVTSGAKVFELRRDEAKLPWRMVYPLQARANNTRIEESLQALQNIAIRQFVSDDPKADLGSFGLQPPELELKLSQGTNPVARLQFGRNPTNDTHLVYARRPNLNAIVTVPKDLLAPWYAPVNDFRDPFLVTWAAPVAVIDVKSEDNFSLQQQTNETWRVLPQNLPADKGLVKDLLSALSRLQVAEFTSDVATAQDLPAYGLAAPVRQYILRSPTTNTPAGPTNAVVVEVDFGTNAADKVYARRTDENFIYAVKFAAFQQLPAVSWEMRDRRIWDFSTNDIVGATFQQEGRKRQVVRNGPNDWSIAMGSQGIINVLGVEEAVKGLCQLTAVAWVAQGDANRARYGLTDPGRRVTLELKNGEQPTVEFSAAAAANSPYAAVTLDGQLWIFQFPTWLYDYVQRYLSVPPNP
jgi:hypothetical protein